MQKLKVNAQDDSGWSDSEELDEVSDASAKSDSNAEEDSSEPQVNFASFFKYLIYFSFSVTP